MSDTDMSTALAAWILAEIASEKTRTELDVTALQMGAKRLLARWFQRQRSHAVRRGGRQQAYNSKAAEPLSPEEELADTIARQKEEP